MPTCKMFSLEIWNKINFFITIWKINFDHKVVGDSPISLYLNILLVNFESEGLFVNIFIIFFQWNWSLFIDTLVEFILSQSTIFCLPKYKSVLSYKHVVCYHQSVSNHFTETEVASISATSEISTMLEDVELIFRLAPNLDEQNASNKLTEKRESRIKSKFI